MHNLPLITFNINKVSKR